MALLKLKQLLSGRFGKGLEVRQLMDLSKLKRGSEPVIQGNDLYIPIVVQEQFLGTAVIPYGWELCEEKKKDVVQLVRMVLEPTLYKEFLERRESNLQSIESLSFSETKPLITSLLHMYSPNEFLIKKIAWQIHEFSARWAFVSFTDICSELHTALDISNLGGMTIYVDKLEALSEQHQALLAEYTRSPRSLAEPLILTGSTLPLVTLKTRLVNASLVADIQESHLEIDRAPLSSERLRELLSLFFHQDEVQDFH